MPNTDRGDATPNEVRSPAHTTSPSWRVQRRTRQVTATLAASPVGEIWQRLTVMECFSRAMQVAGTLLICFVPFLIVLRALVGRSAADAVIRRFGLNHAAADVVTSVFATPAATSAALTGLGYVLFILGGVAGAGSVQSLYLRAFGLGGRGFRDSPLQIAWLGLAVGSVATMSQLTPWLDATGGAALVGFTVFVSLIGFWWLTIWLLLGGRSPWSRLVPAALATAVCWMGMGIFFHITMSGTITSSYARYGAIGVVLALMSYLIAVGVVIILGAVCGMLWEEHRRSSAAA